MYSRNVFGNYYPVDSIIHKLNPVMKFINFLMFLMVVCLSGSLYLHLFMFGNILIMTLLSNVPFSYYFNTIYSARYFYVLITIICALLGINLNILLMLLLKIIVFMMYLALMLYTTSITEIVYAVNKIIFPFNILNKDTTNISVSLSNILSFIPLLITTEQKVLKSEAGRGVDYYNSGLRGKIYSRWVAYKNILDLTRERMAKTRLSNELRLFTIKSNKTNLRTNYIGIYDVISFVFHILIVYGFIAGVGL